MKIDADDYRIHEGRDVHLGDRPTRVKRLYKSKDDYEKTLRKHIKKMREQQNVLYAHDRYALLLIFQAMDAAGKDSAIKHVMSGVNPQGCQVFSFKRPSENELDHDFLWRCYRCLPQRGRIGIFNRSYYEEVLVVRVHPQILGSQRLPEGAPTGDKLWDQRYASIVDMEKHLHRNGTRIIKFFLHVSKEEQRKRLLARIDDPAKNWKFEAGDLKERALWNDYMHAYEKCLAATSTHDSPWYAVPADDKRNARLIISQAILDTLDSLPLKYPRLSDAETKQLKSIRKQLAE